MLPIFFLSLFFFFLKTAFVCDLVFLFNGCGYWLVPGIFCVFTTSKYYFMGREWGDLSKRKSYLLANKQFLTRRNCKGYILAPILITCWFFWFTFLLFFCAWSNLCGWQIDVWLWLLMHSNFIKVGGFSYIRFIMIIELCNS